MKHYKNLLPVYIKGLCSGKYTLQQASDSTGYSINWLCTLKHKYLKQGFSFLDHGNQFRVPANKKSETLKARIAAIYSSDFEDVNFTYFREYLASMYDIKISLPTLKSVLNEYGIFSPEARRQKKKKKIKRPRVRRSNEGDMIQIDGTPYAWFYKFGDNKRYCLVGSIDDATGKITGLYMTEHECLYGYLEIMRQTCLNFGVPREVYSDRAAIFCTTPNKHQKLDQWEKLAVLHSKNTQWQRVLDELSIRQILAWSPEAKGRVERMWRTIQGQLPVWLKLHKCSNMFEANKNLYKYIEEFNSKYAVDPFKSETFWISPPENLDDILQCIIERHTDATGVFKFHAYRFAVESPYPSYRDIKLCISERGIFAYLDKQYYNVRCLDAPLDGLGEKIPQVLQDLIYRYLFAYGKEISA